MNESSACDQYGYCEHHKECMTQAPPFAQRLFECSQPLNHPILPRDRDTAVPATPGVEGRRAFPHAKTVHSRARRLPTWRRQGSGSGSGVSQDRSAMRRELSARGLKPDCGASCPGRRGPLQPPVCRDRAARRLGSRRQLL